MSLLSSVEDLKCVICPFFNKNIFNRKCFLDSNTTITDENSYPSNCPMLDGRVITVQALNGKLIIQRDYE
ncbi:MAG TPA: hypothetical protein VMX17_11435 [Candidatus Glassbacteria bacterium]|nr:hypothetical protein [Candidatus Glassbacteria bacterium]